MLSSFASMRRKVVVPAVLLVVAIALAGCSSGGSTAYDSGGTASSGADKAPNQSGPEPAKEGSGANAVVNAATPREIVTTGTVLITATHPLDASAAAAHIVESAGGRVDSRTEQAPTDGNAGSAALTLRIPSSVLTATIDSIKKLGRVESVQLSAQDVTAQGRDLDSRIAALDASVGRLLKLLATAKDTRVLIEIETAVSDRQGELDSLKAQRRDLTDQVTMSTIQLKLVSKQDAPAKAPTTFVDSLLAGLAGFGAFFTGLFFVFGYLLPWLALAAVVTIVIVLIVRRRRTTPPVADIDPVAPSAP
ncbi:MAG: hypothetical protein JWR53_279 [Glaciihabitans sp.]|nr:hypothetical protein [Glaciihabitans sp.]